MTAIGAWLIRAWGRVQGWAIAVLAALAVIGAAFVRGRRAGRKEAATEAQANQARRDTAARNETIQAGQERANVENDIAGRPNGDAGQRLRDHWTRD